MGRRFVAASSQQCSVQSAVVSSFPLTMACWVRPTTVSANQALMSIHSKAANANRHILTITSVGRLSGISGATATATCANSPVVDVWQHAAFVVSSVSSRSIFLNASGKVTNTTSSTPAGLVETSIGSSFNGTSRFAYMSGLIAIPAIWNVALTDAEILQLAQGAAPQTIRPQNLVAYWPLNTPGSTVEFDQNPFAPRRYDLTVTGATQAIDPPIWTPKRKRFWIPAIAGGGSTLNLTPGAASITFTAQSGVVQNVANLSPGASSIIVTAQAGVVQAGANLTPSAASIVVTTQQGVLQQTANLTPGSCSIVVTQQAGTLQQVNRLNPSPAAIVVTQQSGTIQEINRLSPTPAAILVTMQAGLLQTGATNIVPGAAQILVTMQAGVVVVPVNGIVFASATISAPSVRATIAAPTASTSIATAKAFATIAVPKVTATISRPTVAASITRF